MQKNTYTWRSHTVSAVKKSTASIPAACARRNFVQDWPARRGVGPAPAARRILHTVAADTRYPRPASSPWIRRWPHAGFSPASRKISRRTSARVEGRPG